MEWMPREGRNPPRQSYRPPRGADLAARWFSRARNGHETWRCALRRVRGPLAAVPQGVHAPSPLHGSRAALRTRVAVVLRARGQSGTATAQSCRIWTSCCRRLVGHASGRSSRELSWAPTRRLVALGVGDLQSDRDSSLRQRVTESPPGRSKTRRACLTPESLRIGHWSHDPRGFRTLHEQTSRSLDALDQTSISSSTAGTGTCSGRPLQRRRRPLTLRGTRSGARRHRSKAIRRRRPAEWSFAAMMRDRIVRLRAPTC